MYYCCLAVRPRITYLLHLLLLALTLFSAASGAAETRCSHDGNTLAVGEGAVLAFADFQPFAPGQEDSAPRADKLCKYRIREFVAATAAHPDATQACVLCVGSWPSLGCSTVDPVSLPASAFSGTHDCLHVSPRLQLKLQLGQAP